jgi:hypothetical protein
MVLDLAKVPLDAIGVNDNIIVWVQDPEVVCLDVFTHLAELAFEFGAMRLGCHGINGDGISIVFLQCIEDLVVLLARFFEDVLGGHEAMGSQSTRASGGHERCSCFILLCSWWP